jgi:hypothetical protein
MQKYTEADINRILNLRGWIGAQIDVFDLEASLTIGISSDPDRWEITQHTFSSKPVKITLKDFEDCTNEDEVKAAYRKALKRAIAGLVFDGEEIWE